MTFAEKFGNYHDLGNFGKILRAFTSFLKINLTKTPKLYKFRLRFIFGKERKTESIKSTKLKTIHTNNFINYPYLGDK